MSYCVKDLVYCDYALRPADEALRRFLSLILNPGAVRARRAFLEAVCARKPDAAEAHGQESGMPGEPAAGVSVRATMLTDELLDDILRNGLSSSDKDYQLICRLALDSEALGDLHAAVWNASPDKAYWHKKVEAFLANRHERLLDSATELFVEKRWSPARIAKKLHVPRRHVSELLREARRRDILVMTLNRKPKTPVIASSVALSGQWSYNELLSGLCAWSEVLQTVTVVPSSWDGRPPEETTHEMWARRMTDFGKCVGEQLKGLLSQAENTVGVASGETVYRSIAGMPAADAARACGERDPLLCVATVGDLACEIDIVEDILASNLAKRLSQVLNGGKDAPCLTLRTVGAFIPMIGINRDGHPEPIGPGQADAIIQYLRWSNESYRRIFGGNGVTETAVIENLDAILTSCGSADQPNKFWIDELIDGGVSRDKMLRLIDGDIGGVPLMKPGLCDGDVAEFHHILRHWTGIKEEHYRSCATNALTRKRGPGVVLVALGSNKVAAVIRCIRSGLVNHLFIDLDLAQALCKELFNPRGTLVSAVKP